MDFYKQKHNDKAPAAQAVTATDLAKRLREKVVRGTHPSFKADVLAAADLIDVAQSVSAAQVVAWANPRDIESDTHIDCWAYKTANYTMPLYAQPATIKGFELVDCGTCGCQVSLPVEYGIAASPASTPDASQQVEAKTAEEWARENVSPDMWDVAVEAFNAGASQQAAAVAAPSDCVSVKDALRRCGANTDYHGLIAFTQAQFDHFVSMVQAAAKAPAAQAVDAREFVEAVALRHEAIDRGTDTTYCLHCTNFAHYVDGVGEVIDHKPDCIVLRAKERIVASPASTPEASHKMDFDKQKLIERGTRMAAWLREIGARDSAGVIDALLDVVRERHGVFQVYNDLLGGWDDVPEREYNDAPVSARRIAFVVLP